MCRTFLGLFQDMRERIGERIGEEIGSLENEALRSQIRFTLLFFGHIGHISNRH